MALWCRGLVSHIQNYEVQMESPKKRGIRVLENGSLVLPQLEKKGFSSSLAKQKPMRTKLLCINKLRGKQQGRKRPVYAEGDVVHKNRWE